MARSKQKFDPFKTPLSSVITGAIFVALGIYVYFYIQGKEQSGSTFTLPIILDPVYRGLGKGGIAAVFAGAGVLSIGFGLRAKAVGGTAWRQPIGRNREQSNRAKP